MLHASKGMTVYQIRLKIKLNNHLYPCLGTYLLRYFLHLKVSTISSTNVHFLPLPRSQDSKTLEPLILNYFVRIKKKIY